MLATSSCNHVYVAYGSRTGNSEFIAKEFADMLSSEGISNKCMALNSIRKVAVKNTAAMLIIVIATTGNGESPENSDEWWRWISLRSTAKDLFEGIPFAVLGLGDGKHKKFGTYCRMGKLVNKRLAELGGERCLDLCCADESNGMEETIESWNTAMCATVKSKLFRPSVCNDLLNVGGLSSSEGEARITEGVVKNANMDQ